MLGLLLCLMQDSNSDMSYPIRQLELSTDQKAEKKKRTIDSKGKKNQANTAPPDEREAKAPKTSAVRTHHSRKALGLGTCNVINRYLSR